MFITPRYYSLKVFQDVARAVEEVGHKVEALEHTIFEQGRFSMLDTPWSLIEIMRSFHRAIDFTMKNRHVIEHVARMSPKPSILHRIQMITNRYMRIKNHFNTQGCAKGLSTRFHSFKVLQEEQTALKPKLTLLGIKMPVDVDIEVEVEKKKDPLEIVESFISRLSTEHSALPTPHADNRPELFHKIEQPKKLFTRNLTALGVLRRTIALPSQEFTNTMSHSRTRTNGSGHTTQGSIDFLLK